MRPLKVSPEAVIAASLAGSARGSLYSAFELARLSAAIWRAPRVPTLSGEADDMIRRLDLRVAYKARAVILSTGAGARLVELSRGTRKADAREALCRA